MATVKLENKWLSIACCAIASTIFYSFGFITPVHSKPEANVWLLKQTGILLGPCDVYVSDEGLRVQGLKSKMVIISRPPKWQIYAFNEDAQAIWSGPLSDFHLTDRSQRFFSMVGLPTISGLSLTQEMARSELGMKGTRFYTDSRWKQEQQVLLNKKLITDQYPASATYFAATLLTKDQPAILLEHLFDTPRKNLVPLTYEYTKFTGSKEFVLRTFSTKKVSAPINWLQVPKGLKVAHNMQEVNMDQTAKNGLEQMLQNIPAPQ